MSDVSYWDETYRERLDALTNLLATQSSARTPSDLSELFEQVKGKVKLVENARKSFQLDMRALPRAQQTDFLAKFKEYEQELRSLKGDVKALETRVQQAELMGMQGESEGDSGGMDNNSYLKATRDVQQKTDQSLDRTLNIVQDTHEVADATASELKRQREQIIEIQETLLTMEGNLKYAGKLVQDFKKRMMTDKFIRIFFALNVVALLGIIIWYFLHQNGLISEEKDDDNSATTDDTVARKLRGLF